jgi:Asp-tRNA(Asn)/Glu-tRNA(Gln) amidotransferase A subunit family amidase
MARVGIDADDSATLVRSTKLIDIDYTSGIDQRPISGSRVGVLESFRSKVQSVETTPTNNAIDEAIRHLRLTGAEIVLIDDAVYNAANILATLDTQRFEYREALDRYLAREDVSRLHPRDFHELYTSKDFLVIPAQYEYIKTASRIDTSEPHYQVVQEGIVELTRTLQNTFDKLELDAIIYPQQKCLPVKIGSPSQAHRNGILAALTGFPSVCVPAGFAPATGDAPVGVPVGMEILGIPWSEKKLLRIAYEFEGITRVRRSPMLANAKTEPMVELPTDWAEVKPDSKEHAAYPQGVLS